MLDTLLSCPQLDKTVPSPEPCETDPGAEELGVEPLQPGPRAFLVEEAQEHGVEQDELEEGVSGDVIQPGVEEHPPRKKESSRSRQDQGHEEKQREENCTNGLVGLGQP